MSILGGDDELVIRARVDNDASPELRDVRDELRGVATQTERADRAAARASRSYNLMGRAGRIAGTTLKVAAAGAVALGYAAYRVTKSSIQQASDLNESINAVNVSYGKQGRAVLKLGKQAATAVGLSRNEFNALSVRFSSFAKTISGGGRKTVGTLDKLTKRAADFASVMNLDVSDAAELFQSGLAGESEPLRAYGIDVSAATVAAYAYAKGIAKSGEQLTAAQKVQATYGSLMEQTNQVQGDFRNTSDQLANSQRILEARWDNAQAKLGRGLLPLLTTFVGYLNREGIPAVNRFARWFNRDGVPALGDFADQAKDLAREYLPELKRFLTDVYNVVKDLAPLVGGVLKGFNDLPAWAKSAIITTGGTLRLASTLRNARGGVLGSVATMNRPVPVIVTNPGFGKGGTGGVVAGGGGKGGTTKGGRGRSLLMGAGVPGAILTGLSFNEGVQQIMANPFGELKAEVMWPWTDGPFSDKAADQAEENTDRSGRALRNLLLKPLGKGGGAGKGGGLEDLLLGTIKGTQKLGGELDKVSERKVRPDLFIDGMPKAQDATRQLIQQLTGLDRQRPKPTVNLDTSLAEARLAAFRSKLDAMASAGVGVPFVSGGGGVRREHGGRVLPGRSYIVGERRPERFVPDEPGRIIPRVRSGAGGAWGGVTIQNLTVHAEGASSDVDVQDAVTQALDDYFRDREERA